jgi:transposase
MNAYDGKQFVGIDLHRQRSVIVRQTAEGEQLSAVRIVNDPVAFGLQIEKAGPNPEVVLEATHGWYWAVDALEAAGATVHLAHPLGVKGFRYRRVKNGDPVPARVRISHFCGPLPRTSGGSRVRPGSNAGDTHEWYHR